MLLILFEMFKATSPPPQLLTTIYYRNLVRRSIKKIANITCKNHHPKIAAINILMYSLLAFPSMHMYRLFCCLTCLNKNTYFLHRVCKLFFFFLFRAVPTAYGGSQARGLIGATAAGLCHRHSNVRSKPHL